MSEPATRADGFSSGEYRHCDPPGCTLSIPKWRISKRAKPLCGKIPARLDSCFFHEAAPERIIPTLSNKRPDREEIERLLAQTSIVRNGCDLDLLVFLHRHPRTLLTSEQIAAFVGHDMKLVAEALDAFIATGLIERLHNPKHAARMYLLVVHGPEGNGLKTLLELASTRQGRQEILAVLNSASSHAEDKAKDLRLVKGACA